MLALQFVVNERYLGRVSVDNRQLSRVSYHMLSLLSIIRERAFTILALLQSGMLTSVVQSSIRSLTTNKLLPSAGDLMQLFDAYDVLESFSCKCR